MQTEAEFGVETTGTALPCMLISVLKLSVYCQIMPVTHRHSTREKQCDFRIDLFFSFSFVPVFFKPADEDVLMICLNTIHR